MPRAPLGILALDLACTTGWAHSCGESGTLVLPGRTNTGHGNGARFNALYKWLETKTKQHYTRLIVYEYGNHKRGGAPMRIGVGLPTIVELFCFRCNLELHAFHTTTIKKHATGHGFAPKQAMIAAAKEQYPSITLLDDNHVDALWLLHLAVSELGNVQYSTRD